MKRRAWMFSMVMASTIAGCHTGYQSIAGNGLPLEASAYLPGDEPASSARGQKPDGPTTSAPTANPITLVAFPQDAAAGEVKERIVAKVNGKVILESDLQHAVNMLGQPITSEQQRRELMADTLQKLIDRELLIQDAERRFLATPAGKRTFEKLKDQAGRQFETVSRKQRLAMGINSEEEYKKRLQSMGVTFEGLRRNFERKAISEEYFGFLIRPAIEQLGHREIYDYYLSHKEEYSLKKDRVEWEDIFLDFTKYPSRQDAISRGEEIVHRLRAGEKIDAFKQYDDGEAKLRGGAGTGAYDHEVRPPEAVQVLFDRKMKDGDVGPLIVLPTGIHVVRLIRRQNAGVRPFDEKVQTEIRDRLRMEIINSEMKRVLEGMRKKAQIEISETLKDGK